jgi:hypothetical protein
VSRESKDWGLVVECLSPTSRKFQIPPGIERNARMECDGFGSLKGSDLPPAQIKDMLWDWSHVRDSSPAALSSAAKVLRTYLRSL